MLVSSQMPVRHWSVPAQLVSPSTRPHLPSASQTPEAQSPFEVQAPEFPATQVLVVRLQVPEAHAGEVPFGPQVECAPSGGSASPVPAGAVQLNVC